MFLDTTPSPRAKWSVSAFFAKGYVHITNSKQRKHLFYPVVSKNTNELKTLGRLGPVANKDTKLLIYGLFQKG